MNEMMCEYVSYKNKLSNIEMDKIRCWFVILDTLVSNYTIEIPKDCV